MRKGISMVALVITIIVLIVLTSAVVIKGVGAPKQAQLATFYNNVATVQDLVTLQMSDNMITGALAGYDTNCKWLGIVEGYTIENYELKEPTNAFIDVTGINEKIAYVSSELLDKTTLPDGEKSKYYVGISGKVYYEGFEYEEKTYYNKDTSMEGVGEKLDLPIMAMKVKLNPMQYYGAYVNYTKADGEPFGNLDNTENLQWRIFHADGEHIYITTTGHIGARRLDTYYDASNRNEAVEALLANNIRFVNSDVALWAHDGIDYTAFALSYNKVKETNIATLFLEGTESTGFYIKDVPNNTNATSGYNRNVSTLSGMQTNLYDIGKHYWLGSPSIEYSVNLLYVRGNGNYIHYSDYYATLGLRPLVCLKSNVQLVESGVNDANGYMTYNISTITP